MTPHFHEFLLEVLVNAARIDGQAAESEREAIANLMSKAKGVPFSRAEVDAAIDRATLSREDLCGYLNRAGRRYSAEERMTILHGLLAVITADGRLVDAESTALLGYVDAIGFDRSPGVIDKIMQPFRNAI